MNSPLEQYLRQLHQRLRFVPARWRDEQIAEARQHLEARVEELTAAGMSPRDAEEEAVRHFGEPGSAARSLIIAWWRQFLPLDKATRRPMLLATLGFTLVAIVQSVSMAPSVLNVNGFGPFAFGARFPALANATSLLLLLLVGVVVGSWYRRRAVVGAFWGGGMASATFMLAGRVHNAIQMNDPQVHQQFNDLMARVSRGDASVHIIYIPAYLLPLQVASCLAAVCLGAYLGARRNQLHHTIT